MNPAQLVTIIISDVIGNPLEVIASGPTVPDPSTFSDALKIIEKYNLTTDITVRSFELPERGVAWKSS